MSTPLYRRNVVKAAGASLAMMNLPGAVAQSNTPASNAAVKTPTDEMQERTRAQRMQWWHAAKFGMFIHFGVYSTIGRHEWVMEDEAIPIGPYVEHAAIFRPEKNCPRAWARLAKQ